MVHQEYPYIKREIIRFGYFLLLGKKILQLFFFFKIDFFSILSVGVLPKMNLMELEKASNKMKIEF
jgi:hypothetical protein